MQATALSAPGTPNRAPTQSSSQSNNQSNNQPTVSLTLDKTSVICSTAHVEGTLSIGAHTVIHPRARLIAKSGPIIIGQNCLIDENVRIINHSSNPLTIGNWNWFQSGCQIQSSIGHANIFHVNSIVTTDAKIGRGCEIGVNQTINQTIKDGSIVSSIVCHESRLTIKERERKTMEQIKLLIDLHTPILSKQHTLIK